MIILYQLKIQKLLQHLNIIPIMEKTYVAIQEIGPF